MKVIFALFILTCFLFPAKAQEQHADSLYIVTYTTGNAWDNSKKPNEQTYFKEHSTNLSLWRKQGIIKLGARYTDKGIVIISAPNLKAAKTYIDSDPAVANKLFNADVQKLSVFYDCSNK